jgi:hypothetical protein
MSTTTAQPTTKQSTNEHVVAIIDNLTGEEAALQLVSNSLSRGGTATVVVLLTSRVRRTIRDMAREQQISPTAAEQFYVDRIRETVNNVTGGNVPVVTRRSSRVHGVLGSATQATAMAIPTSIAGRRGWGRALATVPIPVTVTPSRAA